MKTTILKSGLLVIGLIFSLNVVIAVGFTNCSRNINENLDLSSNSSDVDYNFDDDLEERAYSAAPVAPPENLKSLNIANDLKLFSEQVGGKVLGKDSCGLTTDAIKPFTDLDDTTTTVNKPNASYDVSKIQNFSCWPQWTHTNISEGDTSASTHKMYANIFTIWQDGNTFYLIVKNDFYFKKEGNNYYLNSPRLVLNKARRAIKLFTVYDTNIEAANDRKFGITILEYKKLAQCADGKCKKFSNVKPAGHSLAIRSMINIAKFHFFVLHQLPGGLQIREAVKSGTFHSSANIANIEEFGNYFRPRIENTITILSFAMLDGWLPFEQVGDRFFYRGAFFYGNSDNLHIKKEWALCAKNVTDTDKTVRETKIGQCVSEKLLASYKDHTGNNFKLSTLTDQTKLKNEIISRFTAGLFNFNMSGALNNNPNLYQNWLKDRWAICSYYANGISHYPNEKLRSLYSCMLQPSLGIKNPFNSDAFKRSIVQYYIDSNYYLYKLGPDSVRSDLALNLKVGDSIRLQFKDPGIAVKDLFVDKVQLYCREKRSYEYTPSSVWSAHPSSSNELQFINKQSSFTTDTQYSGGYENGTSVGVYDNFGSAYDGFCHLEFTFLNEYFHNADNSPMVIKSKELPLKVSSNANTTPAVVSTPPSNLNYPFPDTFTLPTAYTISESTSPPPTNEGDKVVSYTVDPPLPEGLLLNPSSGVIYGKTTTARAAQNYNIIATNSGGSTMKVLNITISDTQACAIENGQGSLSWDTASSSWGVCSATSCNNGYNNINGSCAPVVQAPVTQTPIIQTAVCKYVSCFENVSPVVTTGGYWVNVGGPYSPSYVYIPGEASGGDHLGTTGTYTCDTTTVTVTNDNVYATGCMTDVYFSSGIPKNITTKASNCTDSSCQSLPYVFE
jgi:hypothetical protein